MGKQRSLRRAKMAKALEGVSVIRARPHQEIMDELAAAAAAAAKPQPQPAPPPALQPAAKQTNFTGGQPRLIGPGRPFRGKVVQLGEGFVFIDNDAGQRCFIGRKKISKKWDPHIALGDIVDCHAAEQADSAVWFAINVNHVDMLSSPIDESRPVEKGRRGAPLGELYGEQVPFRGTVTACKEKGFLFLQNKTGGRAFVDGRLLNLAQWAVVGIDSEVEILARMQQGKFALYATEVVSVTDRPMDVQPQQQAAE